VIFGVRLLEVAIDLGIETHLIMSDWAEKTIIAETKRNPDDVRKLASYSYASDNQAARISSGSFLTSGMIVLPCSMRSLAAIANGLSETLVHRAADVVLKEQRKLVLMARESPLSIIHLENMLKVARAGAIVAPPLPAFYSRPKTVEDMIDHTVGRALDLFGIDNDLCKRWGERQLAAADPPVERSG
jgi:4-hydroxy-3-polyprenylbenzoate decarboxylase